MFNKESLKMSLSSSASSSYLVSTPAHTIFIDWDKKLHVLKEEIKNTSKILKIFKKTIIESALKPEKKELFHQAIIKLSQKKIRLETTVYTLEKLLKKFLPLKKN
jgi:hypothetical protein